jgi:predicted RNA binding protein YcfA (HicA-like mRNA interferase family)
MKSSELYKKFTKAGWIELRQTGSHKIMKHPNINNPLVLSVPYHGTKEVPTGIANKLLKQAGLK